MRMMRGTTQTDRLLQIVDFFFTIAYCVVTAVVVAFVYFSLFFWSLCYPLCVSVLSA